MVYVDVAYFMYPILDFFYPITPPFRAPIMVANLAETPEAGSITVE